MGKASRDKGARNEYIVRDQLRALGYEAHRVPCSGAAQGFKGDVTYAKGEVKGVIEVKARKASFTPLYTYNAAFFCAQGIIMDLDSKELAVMGYDFNDVLNYAGGYGAFPSDKAFRAALRKLQSCKKMVKGCDLLALKDDHKKPIFVRYL